MSDISDIVMLIVGIVFFVLFSCAIASALYFGDDVPVQSKEFTQVVSDVVEFRCESAAVKLSAAIVPSALIVQRYDFNNAKDMIEKCEIKQKLRSAVGLLREPLAPIIKKLAQYTLDAPPIEKANCDCHAEASWNDISDPLKANDSDSPKSFSPRRPAKCLSSEMRPTVSHVHARCSEGGGS